MQEMDDRQGDVQVDLRADLERFKANSKLFSLLDAAGIERLARVAKPAAFAASDAVIREGERGNTFFLLLSGTVRVITEGLDEAKEVARLGPGQFFGEMAVLNDEPRTASVFAVGAVRCLGFEKHDVLSLLQDYPKIRQVLGLVGLKRAEQLIDAQLK